jgi:hypothetical protein
MDTTTHHDDAVERHRDVRGRRGVRARRRGGYVVRADRVFLVGIDDDGEQE